MAKNKNDKSNPRELDSQSIEYLGLSKQPFADEILTEQTFFQSQALQKINESLLHQIQFSDLLLIVEGQQGSGKTSLYRQFIQLDITNTKILSIQAEATDTLTQIQQKMSLHLQDLGDANHLEDNLKSLQTFDQMPVLVMDNSHVLSDTTLQELFRFQQQLQQEHSVNLKVLLFANNGMSDTLQKITDLSAEQMYVQNMPVLSPKQVERFIFHKLRHAGYDGEKILDEKTLQQIIRKSDGGLVSIMQCAVPFIEKHVAHALKPGLSKNLKLVLIILLLAVLMTAAAAWFYLNQFGTPSSKDLAQPEGTSTEHKQLDQPSLYLEPEATDTVEQLDEESVAETTVEPTADSVLSHPEVQPDAQVDTAESDTAVIKEPTVETITDATSASIASVADPADQNTVDQKPTISVPAANVNTAGAVTSPVAKETTQAASAVSIASPSLAITSPASKSTSKPASQPAASKPAAKAPAVASLPPALRQLGVMGIADRNWLRKQPDTHWTLQLLGAREPETLLKFARRHQLSSKAAWYKTWLKSKPYYVLVYGSYTSRDSARQAIAGLPPALRANKPWVKSMRSVKQAIK